MKDLNYVAGELVKGKNLPLNLTAYAGSMMNLYYTLAYIKLSMNYYTFYEMANDSEFGRAEQGRLKSLLENFNAIIEKESGGDISSDEGKQCIEELDAIRNEIISVMEVVTAYVDRLRIYEYVLNRIEYRFRDEEFDEAYYGNGLTNDIMHYIFSDKDRVAINSRISEVVEQLPMRLSPNKFYEYLRESFSLYKDAQIGTIDDFAYTVRTNGMLYEPEGFRTMFPEVYELYHDISCADYKDVSKETYDNLFGKLTIAAEKMSDTADMYVMFSQLVNDLYTILLSKPYISGASDEAARAAGVVRMVLEDFKALDGARPYESGTDGQLDELTDSFISFEGRQERIGEMISANDYAVAFALEHYKSNLEESGLAEEYERLAMMIKLQSGSNFVELKDRSGVLDNAEEGYSDRVCNELIEAFEESFITMDRTVRRAVMSSVLSGVPVFFNSVDEIQGYVNTSLALCSDTAEKQACVEVLKLIMQG